MDDRLFEFLSARGKKIPDLIGNFYLVLSSNVIFFVIPAPVFTRVNSGGNPQSLSTICPFAWIPAYAGMTIADCLFVVLFQDLDNFFFRFFQGFVFHYFEGGVIFFSFWFEFRQDGVRIKIIFFGLE